jgi:hypothetical protein
MRAAMNAILYLLRTGCPWRYLPRDSFPPRSTICNILRKFQRDGLWEAIWAELHMALRERMGPGGQPVGSGSRQPIGQIGRKGGGNHKQAGCDAGNQAGGRKIHALIDSEGLPGRGPGPPRRRAGPRISTARHSRSDVDIVRSETNAIKPNRAHLSS